MSQFLWKLVGQLIEEEFASCELEILLVHAVAAFEAGHRHGRRTLEKPEVWIELSRQCTAHLGPTVITEGRQLVWLGALVEQDLVRGGHTCDPWSLRSLRHAWQ